LIRNKRKFYENVLEKVHDTSRNFVINYLPPLWFKIHNHRYLKLGKSFSQLVNRELSVKKYSIIHFHSTFDFYNFILFSEKKLRNLISLLTSHSPIPAYKEIVDNAQNKIKSKKALEMLKKFRETMDIESFKKADYLIFPCEESMEGYLKWEPFRKLLPNKKIAFVLSGVEPMTFKLNSDEIRNRYGIPKDAFVVSYVGRHNIHKGYDVLQEAAQLVWRKNKNVWFLIAGKEWPIKGLDDNRWIEVGWTNDPGSIVNAADLFVLPNRKTYFDLVLLEVLSLGKAVLASSSGGNKYVARQTKGIILFRNADPSDLSLKILQLEGERDFLKKIGDLNKSTYERYYTLELFAQRYAELYKKIEKENNLT